MYKEEKYSNLIKKENFKIIPKLKFIDPGKRKTGKICILKSSEIKVNV